MTAPGCEFGAEGWRERLIDDALREGRITLASAPEWHRKLSETPQLAENQLLGLAAVPSIGEANVRGMDAA